MLRTHLGELHAFYGEETGVRVARKHISWYTKGLAGSAQFRHAMNRVPTAEGQYEAVERFFATLAGNGERLAYAQANDGTEEREELAA